MVLFSIFILIYSYKEIIEKFPVEYTAGGATQNVLRVFQWMRQKGPNCATFVGCVGDDDFGKQLAKSAQKDGVNVQYQISSTHATGTCAVLVSGKERSLVANLAAANHYDFHHFETEPIQQLAKQAKVYYFSGFFLTVSPESIMHCAKDLAISNDKIMCLNLSALFVVDFFTDRLFPALPYVDYLFGNEDEARAFGKKLNLATANVVEIAKAACQLEKVNKSKPRYAVFTQGADPIVVAKWNCHTDGSVECNTYEVSKIPKENIVDTNGAGDSFCGGFLSRLVQGKSIEQCVKAGIWASSIVIQHSGCVFPVVCEYKDE